MATTTIIDDDDDDDDDEDDEERVRGTQRGPRKLVKRARWNDRTTASNR